MRKQFTGYERDNESNLDFAQARYFAHNHGRFTSPDPYKIVAEVQNEPDAEKAKAMLVRYLMQPQQWNQYPYAINNPLKYTDPTGEIIELTGTEEEQQAALARIKAMLGDERFALVKQSTVNGNIRLTIDSGDIEKFARIGNNQENKDFSRGMAGILVNSQTVEFRIAEKFEYKDKNGKTQVAYTGNGCVFSGCTNGGVTLNPSENASGNGNWQLFVNPNAGEVATTAAAGLYWLTGGKGSLVSTNDSVDAHEFGHVWETWQGTRMYGTGRGQERPMRDSLVFENSVHDRYNRLRRVKH